MSTETNIKKLQRATFDILEEAGFNDMDGARIVKDLEENRPLWDRVVIAHSQERGGEFKLRELLNGDPPYIDTLYILPRKEESKKALRSMAYRWKPDEIDWIKAGEIEYLRVFFD